MFRVRKQFSEIIFSQKCLGKFVKEARNDISTGNDCFLVKLLESNEVKVLAVLLASHTAEIICFSSKTDLEFRCLFVQNHAARPSERGQCVNVRSPHIHQRICFRGVILRVRFLLHSCNEYLYIGAFTV